MAGVLPGLGQSAQGQAVTRAGTAVSPANASASFQMLNSGMARSAPTSGVFSDEFQWLTGASGTYWVRATPTSGSFSSGSGTGWVALSTDPSWTRNRTSDTPGTTTVVATVEIATDSAGATIIASFQITLNAIVTI